MTAELSLRVRKKQRTRQLIHETALRLFSERGFDEVTVAEVARAAEVSVVTVFNYFPTKEALFFSGQALFEEQIVEAVRQRQPGEAAVKAVRRLLLDGSRLSTDAVAATIAKAARLIGASPTLQVAEREVVNRYTEELAAVLASETGADRDDIESWVVANALMGLHRAFVAHVRRRATDGWHGPRLAADARRVGERAFARLEIGLGAFALKGREDR
ncbi:TetR/AcrR family transcriptional regulator [Diaminobutyricibacter sp. McL0618]|uniref:TetR/AcrR family transcriptional regulator n=1 Tax=Leifsonia sp. McL0618 TaxID=3415677 RepID=UPI003CF32D4E